MTEGHAWSKEAIGEGSWGEKAAVLTIGCAKSNTEAPICLAFASPGGYPTRSDGMKQAESRHRIADATMEPVGDA